MKKIYTSQRHPRTIRHVAIDLTPLLPGGENGGAKLLSIDLVRNLSQISPRTHFSLLVSSSCLDAVRCLESGNVKAVVAKHPHDRISRLGAYLQHLGKWMSPEIKAQLFRRGRRLIWRFRRRKFSDEDYDLLFCPFTAPFFYRPSIPVVSIVYDVQFRHYPQLFTAHEQQERANNFTNACNYAQRLVCISDYVRRTVLETGEAHPEQVKTIHISPRKRMSEYSVQQRHDILRKFGFAFRRFLLFPANFWTHKNHEMLLTAFGIYRANKQESDLKLALTGHPCNRMQYLKDAVRRMGLDGQVIFCGYVKDEELASLVQSCKAIIFPSLYEGFGIPVLEAMAARVPVACSNVTSLPEVGGDAALYFDPRQPHDIARAIERLESEPELIESLVEKGQKRAEDLGTPASMAKAYWDVFQEVVAMP
jgi:glycosyltransferase involved in cell wall biosynthesis